MELSQHHNSTPGNALGAGSTPLCSVEALPPPGTARQSPGNPDPDLATPEPQAWWTQARRLTPTQGLVWGQKELPGHRRGRPPWHSQGRRKTLPRESACCAHLCEEAHGTTEIVSCRHSRLPPPRSFVPGNAAGSRGSGYAPPPAMKAHLLRSSHSVPRSSAAGISLGRGGGSQGPWAPPPPEPQLASGQEHHARPPRSELRSASFWLGHPGESGHSPGAKQKPPPPARLGLAGDGWQPLHS